MLAIFQTTVFMHKTFDKKGNNICLLISKRRSIQLMLAFLIKNRKNGILRKSKQNLGKYLSESYQFVESNRKQPSILIYKSGMTQRSIFGSLFFSFFLIKFSEFFKYSEVTVCAHNTTIHCAPKGIFCGFFLF